MFLDVENIKKHTTKQTDRWTDRQTQRIPRTKMEPQNGQH